MLFYPIVKSFVGLVEYLFSIPGVKFLMNNRICQDPLKKFFGQQRQRNRVKENSNVSEFIKNTQALHVVNEFCHGIKKGNCRG